MAALTNSGNGTTVSSSSVSQATATADVSVEVSQAVAEIGNDPVLDNETKAALELALSRARMAAEAKNKTGFVEHAARIIDLATKSVDLVPKALVVLGVLAKLFGALGFSGFSGKPPTGTPKRQLFPIFVTPRKRTGHCLSRCEKRNDHSRRQEASQRKKGTEMEGIQKTISIDSDPATRKGVHADAVTVSIKDDMVRLDFLLADIELPDGSERGVLSSRVFMDRGGLELLSHAVNEALAGSMRTAADEH